MLEDLLLVPRPYGFFLIRMNPHTYVLLLKIFPFHKLANVSVVLSEILWAWELLNRSCLIGCLA